MVAVKKEWMFLEFFIIIKNYTSFSKLSLFSPIIKKNRYGLLLQCVLI